MNKHSKEAEVKTLRSYFKSDKRWLRTHYWERAHVKRTICHMERRVNKMLCMAAM
jgi:hypothetical protein